MSSGQRYLIRMSGWGKLSHVLNVINLCFINVLLFNISYLKVGSVETTCSAMCHTSQDVNMFNEQCFFILLLI